MPAISIWHPRDRAFIPVLSHNVRPQAPIMGSSVLEKSDITILYRQDFPLSGFDGVVFDSRLKDFFLSQRVDALLIDELKKRIIGSRSRTNTESEQFDRLRFFHTQSFADFPPTFYTFIGGLAAEYLGVRIQIKGVECSSDTNLPAADARANGPSRALIDNLAASTLRLEASIAPPGKPH